MPNLNLASRLLVIGMMVMASDGVFGQDFPSRPIRLLTGGAAGANDYVARVISTGLASRSGWSVIVDNRAGGIQTDIVANSLPDGYNLLVEGLSLWVRPTAHDPIKAYSPITLAANAHNIVVVHPALPVKSIKELIALAKSKPGELNFATNSNFSSTHLAGELFKYMAGINIVRVNFKATPQALSSIVSGEVQMMIAATVGAMPFVKGGKLKALAIASAAPSPLFPDLPTVSATGLPGYEAEIPFAVYAPAGTPRPIIVRLNTEITQVLQSAEAKGRLYTVGLEVVANSPEQLAGIMKSEMIRLGKVIKAADIREEKK